MERRISNPIIELMEENDFSFVSVDILDDTYMAEFETYSPAGEDLIIDIWYDGTEKDFVQKFAEYAQDFDVEYHVEMWVEAKRNGVSDVPRIVDLVEDAEAIQDMLNDMAAKLLTAYENNKKAITEGRY